MYKVYFIVTVLSALLGCSQSNLTQECNFKLINPIVVYEVSEPHIRISTNYRGDVQILQLAKRHEGYYLSAYTDKREIEVLLNEKWSDTVWEEVKKLEEFSSKDFIAESKNDHYGCATIEYKTENNTGSFYFDKILLPSLYADYVADSNIEISLKENTVQNVYYRLGALLTSALEGYYLEQFDESKIKGKVVNYQEYK